MADLDKFIKDIKELSVIDLHELVKKIEEEFGVSSSSPIMMAAGDAGGGSKEEEKSSFNVYLAEVGANKVGVIKVVKEITGKGLKESKELVDSAPKEIKENLSKEEAEEIKSKLEAAGAKVELK